MIVNKRLLMIVVGVCGVALGVAFGIGVAYGRGDPKTVETGLNQQQIASLLGGGATGTGGAGAQQLGNNTIGQVTAVEGQTVTVKTAQAEVKVTLDANTKVSRYGTDSKTLQVGDSVVVAGTRGSDGAVTATSISQMPPELASLGAGGSTPSGAGRPGAAATATP